MAETLLAGQYMFLKNNKGLFRVAALWCEISNQIIKELINFKDLFVN